MAHVATITIDHTKVPGDLTDYVGLIVPDGSAGYAALYALCLEGGGDIRLFKSDDTTELPREVVSFSVSAETGEIHYRYAGTLSSSVDTDIHVYADGSSSDYAVSATYGSIAVWVDYLIVTHGNNNTDSAGNYDSTGMTLGGETGKIGTASYFDNSSQFIYSNDAELTEIKNRSISMTMWVKNMRTTSGAEAQLFGNYPGNGPSPNQFFGMWVTSSGIPYVAMRRDDGAQTIISDDGLSVNTSTWQKLTFVKDGLDFRFFQNGTQVGSDVSFSTEGNTRNDFKLGGGVSINNRFNTGYFEEVRYRDSLVTENWITTEYNNQNANGSFWEATDAGGGGSTPAQAARRGAVMMM